MKGSLIYF